MTEIRAKIPDEIYRFTDRWHLDHFPAIANKRNHTVLFQLPLPNDLSHPPEPRTAAHKWDLSHVRLPCSAENVLQIKILTDPVELETKIETKKRWDVIQNTLSKDIRSTQELEEAILIYNPEYENIWNFEPLHTLFEKYLDRSESDLFFEDTLPHIIRMALKLPELVPSAIPLLRHGQNKSISLSQQQIACLLANAFLCTFPDRSGTYQSSGEFSTFPSVNFSSLFQTFGNASLQKIRCFLNYFRRQSCSSIPVGVVTFSRRSMAPASIPKWSKCQMDFKKSLLHVSKEGTIENDGDGLLQVDFANSYVGGGILVGGCVQEEIRFAICPELICSRLFTETLRTNECLTIMGFERFNDYKGYGPSFEWNGDYKDETPFDSFRRRKCSLVAIDAHPFEKGADQYREFMLKRELNKAFVGFKHELPTPTPGIATGNWGCGAFNGDKCLKAVLQLIASVVNDRPLVYFTFKSEKFGDELIEFHKFLSESKITIAQLWKLLREYAVSKSKEPLYEYIKHGHENATRGKTQTNSTKFDKLCSTFKRRLSVLNLMKSNEDNAAQKGDTSDGDLLSKENDPNKHKANAPDEMEASCSTESKTELLSATEFFKSFSPESENSFENDSASKSP